MTRKGKQPGGHNPLTYNERKKYTSSYGTTTTRLTTESHTRFGDCCLGLSPAIQQPVVTPSGHIYSREAILLYLLTKTQELERERSVYESRRADRIRDGERKREKATEERRMVFVENDTVGPMVSMEEHAWENQRELGKRIDVEGEEERKRGLKRTSYWLSESQPEYGKKNQKEEGEGGAEDDEEPPPPKRPPSPMSGQPLRRKDLIPITLQREDEHETHGQPKGKCLCAVSGKAITTQEVVLIKKTGVVMLKECYESLFRTKKAKEKKEDRICPITGKKFREKDVMELTKGTSGYAASGKVVAKKYRPTMT